MLKYFSIKENNLFINKSNNLAFLEIYARNINGNLIISLDISLKVTKSLKLTGKFFDHERYNNKLYKCQISKEFAVWGLKMKI